MTRAIGKQSDKKKISKRGKPIKAIQESDFAMSESQFENTLRKILRVPSEPKKRKK